jgi:hypothetical protein
MNAEEPPDVRGGFVTAIYHFNSLGSLMRRELG